MGNPNFSRQIHDSQWMNPVHLAHTRSFLHLQTKKIQTTYNMSCKSNVSDGDSLKRDKV